MGLDLRMEIAQNAGYERWKIFLHCQADCSHTVHEKDNVGHLMPSNSMTGFQSIRIDAIA